MLSTRNPFSIKGIERLKVNGCRKIFHANIYVKKTRVPILISVRADFKARNNIRD